MNVNVSLINLFITHKNSKLGGLRDFLSPGNNLLVWTSLTPFKEAALEAAVMEICAKSKNIN